MKKAMLAAAAAAVFFSASVSANETGALPHLTQAMKMGDTAMTCEQLLAEANTMETILGGSPQSGLMDSEYVANVGTGLAQQAAIMGGAGRAAGAIGSVGGMLGKASKKKKEDEAVQKTIAEKRWIYMVGLYQGRNCGAPGAR